MLILCIVFVLLVLLFLTIFFLSGRSEGHRRVGKILMEILIALGMWISVVIWLLSIPNRYSSFIVFWLTIVPYGFYLFMMNRYWLFGAAEKKRRNRIGFYVLLLLPTLVLFSPFFLLYNVVDGASFITIDHYVLLLCATTIASIALAWLVYKNSQRDSRQVMSLKKTLGQSVADLQLLRSQINPHFLFNTLNSLYGMAIQEQAAKTGEGIQRLGDMMRFMLEDNQRTFIPLNKEIHYLEDYIYIQQLRLEHSAHMQLHVAIQQPEKTYAIAPMLLIPFVENAFKYGVRQQQRSWIKIALSTQEGLLHLRVQNSRHVQAEAPGAKDHASTGLGLKNVRERLNLLYAGKHQLRIQEEGEEYAVDLTVNLNDRKQSMANDDHTKA